MGRKIHLITSYKHMGLSSCIEGHKPRGKKSAKHNSQEVAARDKRVRKQETKKKKNKKSIQ